MEHLSLLCKNNVRPVVVDDNEEHFCYPQMFDFENSRDRSSKDFIPKGVVLDENCFSLHQLLRSCRLVTLLFSTARLFNDDGTKHFLDVNRFVFQVLQKALNDLHNNCICLKQSLKLLKFWNLVAGRFSTNLQWASGWLTLIAKRLKCSGPTGTHRSAALCKLPNMNCYVTSSTPEHYTLLFSPATFQDVLLFYCDGKRTDMNSLKQNGLEANGTLSFPMFCFFCCKPTVQSNLINNLAPEEDEQFIYDAVEDFRSALSPEEPTLTLLHKQVSQFSLSDDTMFQDSSSAEQIAEEPCCECVEDFNFAQYGQQLEDAYAYSVVAGIYKALKADSPIHPIDLRFAIDCQCEESTVEIDISEFLKVLCSHAQQCMKQNERCSEAALTWIGTHSSTDDVAQLFHDPHCSSVRQIYCKQLFNNIIEPSFRLIPAYPEYFVCIPNESAAQSLTFMSGDRDFKNAKNHAAEVSHLAGNLSDADRRPTATNVFSADEDSFYTYLEDTENDTLRGMKAENAPTTESKTESTTSPLRNIMKAAYEDYPVFLQITCSTFVGDKQMNFPINQLPTCLNEIFDWANVRKNSDLHSVKVILEFNVLAPSSLAFEDHVPLCESDTASVCFESIDLAINDPDADYGRLFVGAHYKLAALPAVYKSNLETLYSQTFLLVRNEIIFAYRKLPKISTDTIHTVASHIRSISKYAMGAELSAFIRVIPLVFVMHEPESLQDFLLRLKSIKFAQYTFQQYPGNYFIANFCKEYTDERKRSALSCKLRSGGQYVDRENALQRLRYVKRSHSFSGIGSKLLMERDLLLSCHKRSSNICDINSFSATNLCYAESGTSVVRRHTVGSWREEGFECNFANFKYAEARLYDASTVCNESSGVHWAGDELDFWLILHVVNDSVEIFFQERKAGVHRDLLSNTVQIVSSILKKTNQKMLLEHLYKSRTCHPLLIEEKDSFIWGDESSSFIEDLAGYGSDPEDGYLAATSKFPPGYFACPCVAFTWFFVHPRLKQGSDRSGTALVIAAVRLILNKFAVYNQGSVYVFKDCNMNTFYVRLHERVENSILKRAKCSRSPNESDGDRMSGGATTCTVTLPKGCDASAINGNYVLLTVHGIEKPGANVLNEILPALQSRIDETVLDVFLLALSRNPNLRLTSDDIAFLQPRNAQPDYLYFTIPSVAILHLYPFSYYFSQHLSDFLDTPKYVSPSDRFLADSPLGKTSAMATDEHVISYIYRSSDDRKGLAVLCYSFVNRNKNRTLLVHCDPLDKNGYNSFFNHIYSYEELIKAEKCCLSADSKKSKKPMIVVQFVIWKRGTVNMDPLQSLILSAISRACFDLVIEYGLLTMPVFHADSKVEAFSSSEPGSPVDKQKSISACETHERNFSFASRMALRSPFERSSIFSFENFQMLVKKTDATSLDEAPKRKDSNSSEKSIFSQSLSSVYSQTAINWFDFGAANNCASVQRLQLRLMSSMSRSSLAEECREIIQRMVEPDSKCFAFVKHHHDDGDAQTSSRYCSWYYSDPANQAVNKRLDPDKCVDRDTFIIVGLPLVLWKETLIFSKKCSNEDVPSSITDLMRRADELKQRYRPFLADKKLNINWGFIPRQRFLMLFIDAQELRLYTYNWLLDFSNVLGKMIKSTVHRYNSRIHLLQQICLEKIGLPRQAMGDYCLESCLDSVWQSPEKYSAPKRCVDQLGATSATAQPIAVENVFRDDSGNLWADLKSLDSFNCSDIAQAFIEQYINARRLRLDSEKFSNDIASLTGEWSADTLNSAHVFEESFLSDLCSKSSLLHMVFTPLMFEPRWREKLALVRAPISSSVVHKSCSLTTLRQLLRTHAFGGGSLQPTEIFQDQRVSSNSWHLKIQRTMLDHFTDYIHALNIGLVKIRLRSNVDSTKTCSPNPSVWFLRQCSDGFLLAHFFFMQPYLGGHFYTFSSSALGQLETFSSVMYFQKQTLSEVCRVLIMDFHVHSFTYDFHLRTIASLVSGYQVDLFCAGYDLRSMLEEFSLYYFCRPLFARTFFFKDEIALPVHHSDADHLYSYLLEHGELYNLKAVDVHLTKVDTASSSPVGRRQRVLSAHHSHVVQVKMESDGQADCSYTEVQYDIYHLIMLRNRDRMTHKTSLEMSSRCEDLFRFEVFTICLDSSSVYPHDTKNFDSGRYDRVNRAQLLSGVEKDTFDSAVRECGSDSALLAPARVMSLNESAYCVHKGLAKSLSLTEDNFQSERRKSTPTFDLYEPIDSADCNLKTLHSFARKCAADFVDNDGPTCSHFPLRPERVNHVTFIPELFEKIEAQLSNEQTFFKSSLQRIVQEAASQCYWDNLWRKLLCESFADTSMRRENSSCSSISFDEFETLMCSIHSLNFVQLDARVLFMLQLSPSRAVGLMRCLQQKFSDRSRYICSDDLKKQYLVILSQSQLNCFIMVSVDFTDRTSNVCLCCKEGAHQRDNRDDDDEDRLTTEKFCEEFVNAAAFHLWVQLCPSV